MSLPDLDCDCSMADYIPFPLSPSPEQKPYIPVSVHDDNRGGHNSHSAEDDGDARYLDPHYEQADDDDYTSSTEPNSSRPNSILHLESIIQSGHVHKPSNRIIIYPFPADIAPADLRELMQSTIGPVRAVTMICVSAREAAAEIWFLRNDAWRASQKFDQCRIDDGPAWSVFPLVRGETVRVEECVQAHRMRMRTGDRTELRLGKHFVTKPSKGNPKTRRRAEKRKRASMRKAWATMPC